MERQHFHALGLDDPDAVEQMLLGEPLPARRPWRRAAAQLVDQLVDAARTDDADDSAGDRLPPCQLISRRG